MLVGVLAKYPQLCWPAIAVAIVANTLGAMTSYAIGRLFPNKIDCKALSWLKRYTEWALPLLWVALVGDALCIAAGWIRVNTWLLMMMALGEFARYIAVAAGCVWFAETFLH